jgi:hypothetical protein
MFTLHTILFNVIYLFMHMTLGMSYYYKINKIDMSIEYKIKDKITE